MKFTTLLISAAIAAIASAIPLKLDVKVNGHKLTRRCTECTKVDDTALDMIVKASASHYSIIAHDQLNSFMTEIRKTQVTYSVSNLPNKEELLNDAVQVNFDQAKQACAPDALAPIIKEAVASDDSLDVAWSKKEEVEKKIERLDVTITKLMLERIHKNINAEYLSKECTEKVTNTKIAPAPAPASVRAPTHSCSDCHVPKAGIDVPTSVDHKFVCRTGCEDSRQANMVLNFRANLENQWKPRVEEFYVERVPNKCEEKRESLLETVLNLVGNLNHANV
ncbi:hypothetical protein BGZ49_000427 [Haplosporangium sp. Z 27]|nr:hypothetical protein BGZ49_000427 [Haplosporangium sp. Z 27]